MQLFVRDASTVVVEASASTTVLELKELWTQKAFGVVSTESWSLVHGGRALPDAATLAQAGLADGAALCARLRLRGGGGDGGSTGAESRSCYLEMYQGKKPDKVNPAEELLARWTRCHLSGEPLAEPVVIDELGSLFNKESIVHALLARTMPPALAHVSGLKALTTLRLEPVPKAKGGAASNGKAGGGGGSEWQCPVTGLEMNGRARFVVHRPTGTALSERAVKEARAAVEELLGGPWSNDDLIVVNPTGDELFEIKERLAARMAAETQKKLAKKMAKRMGAAAAANGAVAVESGAAGAAAAAAVENWDGAGAAARGGSPGGSGGSGGGSGGSGGGVARAEGGAGSKRPAAAAVGPAATAAAAAAAAPAGAGQKASKKMKVPENATPEVYKSIFHTAAQAAAQKETYACRAVSGRWRC